MNRGLVSGDAYTYRDILCHCTTAPKKKRHGDAVRKKLEPLFNNCPQRLNGVSILFAWKASYLASQLNKCHTNVVHAL